MEGQRTRGGLKSNKQAVLTFFAATCAAEQVESAEGISVKVYGWFAIRPPG